MSAANAASDVTELSHGRCGAGAALAARGRCDDDAAMPARQSSLPHTWSDERVSRELESWFAKCAFEVWPTYRTFVRDGRKRLHAAVMQTGGPQRWALELGVPLVPHRPGPALGARDIELALRRVLREHRPQRFPTNAWLRRHGPPGLAAAVKRTGGGVHWARALRMPAPQPAR